MLLGFRYSQCNESNWEEYYPEMQWCDLAGADLTVASHYVVFGDDIISLKRAKKAPELTEALGCGVDETRTRNFRRDRPVL